LFLLMMVMLFCVFNLLGFDLGVLQFKLEVVNLLLQVFYVFPFYLSCLLFLRFDDLFLAALRPAFAALGRVTAARSPDVLILATSY
jgi:hypothetical protein